MTWTSELAAALGAPEAGLKLILGQVAGYPLFLFYRSLLRRSDPWLHYVFFAVTGILMAWFSIGLHAVFHSSVCIAATYLVLRTLGGSRATAVGLFVFNLGYLFAGYLMDASSGYDITWTMPQCVLCLRLIGLGFDLWDGTKPKESWSKDQVANALGECPSLLECLGHGFFLGGYFVGPQFSMKKLKAMIDRNRTESPDADSPVTYGFARFAVGWAYMIFHLIGSGYIPEHWPQTEEFGATPFLKRSFYFYIWVKIILAKYISAWLLAEGACVIAGLGFNGKDESTGQTKWNGSANVHVFKFETCQKFQHIIDAFNVNTNGWVLSYVYKRLRFLNNKTLSQVGTLVFLAVWHGYHSGYYITFFNEFMVMLLEREFLALCARSSLIQSVWSTKAGALACAVLGHLYYALLLPHCFLAFALLKSAKYVEPYRATGWLLHLYFVVGFVFLQVLNVLVKKPKAEKPKEQ